MAPPTFADQAPAIVHENLQHMVGERVRVVFYDDFTSEEKLNGRLGEVMGVASVEQCADAITAGTLVEVEVRLDEDAEHTEGEPNTRKFPPRCLIHAEHRHGEAGAETVTPEVTLPEAGPKQHQRPMKRGEVKHEHKCCAQRLRFVRP